MIHWKEAALREYDNHIVPAYRINYYMTQKEYTSVMNAIDCFWLGNANSYTFWKHKITSRLRGQIITVKINP